ncbi:hypothetical protein D9M71_825100 [compost metagenome]
MTFDGHVQAACSAAGQSCDVALGPAQQRQGGVGQLQQAQPGTGEADGLGLAHEQRQTQAFFKLFELVRQGRLGQVQALGGLHQAIGLAQGMKGFQVANLQHG